MDELLSSECQEGGRFANLQDTDLIKIVTESYSKYSDIEIHFYTLINLKTALKWI